MKTAIASTSTTTVTRQKLGRVLMFGDTGLILLLVVQVRASLGRHKGIPVTRALCYLPDCAGRVLCRVSGRQGSGEEEARIRLGIGLGIRWPL